MSKTEYSTYGKTKNRGNEQGQAIAKLIREQYQPHNKDEMQAAIKDVEPYVRGYAAGGDGLWDMLLTTMAAKIQIIAAIAISIRPYEAALVKSPSVSLIRPVG